MDFEECIANQREDLLKLLEAWWESESQGLGLKEFTWGFGLLLSGLIFNLHNVLRMLRGM